MGTRFVGDTLEKPVYYIEMESLPYFLWSDMYTCNSLKKNVVVARLNVDMEDLESIWQDEVKKAAEKTAKDKKINYKRR